MTTRAGTALAIRGRVRTAATCVAQTYGDDPEVLARVLEYCGATPTGAPSAASVAALRGSDEPFATWGSARRHPVSAVAGLLHEGGDLARSLWDTRHLVFLVDLDHLNPDDPGQPFLHPADVFVRLEPTYRATRHVMSLAGLAVLPVMTGRGYHFVGTVPLEHTVVDRLAALRPDTPRWWRSHEQRRPPGVDARISERQARAAEGLGLLLEYLAHQIVRRASAASPIPVTVNGTGVGQGMHGRECVSVDFSHAGDPLDMRYFRVAFGPYEWHRARLDIVGAEAAHRTPDLVALPRARRNLLAMLLGGRTPPFARQLARRSHARIPDVAQGVGRLLDRYDVSRLARFHRVFAGRDDRPPPAPDRRVMPPCVSLALDRPNDLLLKPEHIQHLTRWLVSCGWTARQVAERVCSIYEQDHGWGHRWMRGDARMRADFDVRVFGGMIAAGHDAMIDFNCVSAQEKFICPRAGCPHDLRADRDRALALVSP